MAVAFAAETRMHPTTGEPHVFVESGALDFDAVASPIYPPEALGDLSLPQVVRCGARLWARADGTVETVELLECPEAFRGLTEAAFALYRFHDPAAAGAEPLVTDVVTEFERPEHAPRAVPEGEEIPENLLHPVTRAMVPVVLDPKVLKEKRPVSTSDAAASCPASLFMGVDGRVEVVQVAKDCPWPKAVVRAAMKWRFEPWVSEATPVAFATFRVFEIDP